MKRTKLSVVIVEILVAIMPFHPFIFNLIQANGVLVLWRDALVLLALFLVLFENRFILRLNRMSCILLVSYVLCIIHAALYHDSSMSAGIWVNTLRVYLMPSLIYFVCLNSNMGIIVIEKLKHIFIYEAVGICVFGVLQQLIIGSAFIDFMGYRRESITFATGIQRNIGLFESANIMALYLLLAFILTIEDISLDSKKKKIFEVILLVGFILTFSFSSYIAMIAAMVFRFFMKENGINQKIVKGLKNVCLVIIGLCFFFVFDNYALNAMVRGQLQERIADVMLALTSSNLNAMTTSSAVDHILSITESMKEMLKNPMGVGFSVGTFMVLGKVDNLLYAVESSVFTILYDFGWIAGISYLFPYITELFSKKYKNGYRRFSSRICSLAVIIVFVFLPLVQSYELRFFYFLILALEEISQRNKENLATTTN